MTHDFDHLYVKARAYCTTQVNKLTTAQRDQLPACDPVLARWLQLADAAAEVHDERACAANLRKWMEGWKAAVQTVRDGAMNIQLDMPIPD